MYLLSCLKDSMFIVSILLSFGEWLDEYILYMLIGDCVSVIKYVNLKCVCIIECVSFVEK